MKNIGALIKGFHKRHLIVFIFKEIWLGKSHSEFIKNFINHSAKIKKTKRKKVFAH